MEVVSGTGMGMVHSGATSNLALWHLVERVVLKKKGRFEIIEYVRFFDDILVIGCSEAGVRGFLAMLAQAARPQWELELDAVSCDGVVLLDTSVQAQRHGDQWGVTWKAHTKPTARHLALHSDSLHTKSVHASWPIAEIQRMRARSRHHGDYKVAKDQKLQRFKNAMINAATLRECHNFQPAAPSTIAAAIVGDSACDASRCIRLATKWHTSWKGLPGVMQACMRTWRPTLLATGLNINVNVAWRKAGPSLSSEATRTMRAENQGGKEWR